MPNIANMLTTNLKPACDDMVGKIQQPTIGLCATNQNFPTKKIRNKGQNSYLSRHIFGQK